VDKPPIYLGDINLERVLIIGDFVVPQCTRYRIKQKVEQLGAAGVDATTINWMEIGDQIDQLPFHDIVIFYRVPAVPRVLKAMAQVAAAGKLAIYEIDDLLFEPIYPPPLHTYGTLVDEQTYAGLMKGMALYNAAVRCCRIGIASTQALVARLGPLTQSGRCILHRNGLDSQNVSRLLDRSFKNTIDIFYGSGTKAHNSDLTEIIVPAMEKTLSKHREARFIVMGYAQLPNSFIDRFGAQVLQITLSNTVRAYYEVLQWADINIAALHTDSMNDCKSELKWFEAACFGIPSVMSPTANYLDIIKNGEDGFIAETTEDWVKTLNNLIIDANLRQSMGVQAHDRVLSEYTPDVLGKDLMVELKRTVQKLQDINRGDLKKPKVAIVNVFLSPQLIGGATRVVQDNLDDFAKYHSDDFDVVLFSSNVDDHPAHRVSVHMDGPRRNYRTTIMHREYMDWHPRDPKLYSLFSDFLAIEKPDIVHFHCLQRLTASVVDAARDANVPYVVTIHDAWWISDHQFMVTPQADVFLEGHPDPFTQSTSASIMTEQKSMERRNYLKSLLLEAKAVTTVSDSYAKIYACNGITRIQTIPNGISGSLDWCKKDTAARERVVIGHIGGMSAHKGFNLLRETVRSLDLNNVEILVVDHSMEELAIRRDRWGNVPVKFIGRVPQFKIVDLYRQIDVLAAPSIWPESFGLVTREAAACGCWVIASNIGGIGEDIIEGKNGFSIKPEPNALAKTLIEIDSNPKRFKLSINIQQIRYSKEQAESLASLYEEITPEFIVRKN
jgi:glycosyltransferase involved in cell wall biosynthesis